MVLLYLFAFVVLINCCNFSNVILGFIIIGFYFFRLENPFNFNNIQIINSIHITI